MICRVCLFETTEGPLHRRCASELFDHRGEVRVEIDRAKLNTYGLAMVGQSSLTGVHPKLSLEGRPGKWTLRLVLGPGQYILKPQSSVWAQLPENEHLSSRLARLVGIEAPPSGLVPLQDGSLAFLSRRFDRTAAGKLRMEDFCQLTWRFPRDKYRGSAELCVRTVREHTSEPLVELRKLYRLLVFSWWIGNNDMHLKNFSLLTGTDARVRLSPAYDQLSTLLVLPSQKMALPVTGRRDPVWRSTWAKLAGYAGLPDRAAMRVLSDIASKLEPALELVGASFLSEELKVVYRRILVVRTAILEGRDPPEED